MTGHLDPAGRPLLPVLSHPTPDHPALDLPAPAHSAPAHPTLDRPALSRSGIPGGLPALDRSVVPDGLPVFENRRDDLYVLYRGPLASCNYDCPYCPFAKRVDPPELLRADRADLERFAGWVEATTDRRLSVLFTPWGEGLTRSWYRDAIVRLSHLPHVARVAIQTNLAARIGWLAEADPRVAALWATYHPGQVTRERFLARCRELLALGVRFSAGVVGLPGHHAEAVALRDALPPEVYLWVNAAEGHVYTSEEERLWSALDPRFGDSVRPHPSLGLPCHAGETAISVLGDGTVRRCHFIKAPIGNLYDGTWRAALQPRSCTNALCDCHIGYVHLKPLGLRDVYTDGLLERIPAVWP